VKCQIIVKLIAASVSELICLVLNDLHGSGASLKETAPASRVVGFNSRSQKVRQGKFSARREKQWSAKNSSRN